MQEELDDAENEAKAADDRAKKAAAEVLENLFIKCFSCLFFIFFLLLMNFI